MIMIKIVIAVTIPIVPVTIPITLIAPEAAKMMGIM